MPTFGEFKGSVYKEFVKLVEKHERDGIDEFFNQGEVGRELSNVYRHGMVWCKRYKDGEKAFWDGKVVSVALYLSLMFLNNSDLNFVHKTIDRGSKNMV